MAKIKVHELKKELGIDSKDIIAVLEQNGVTGKKPQSALDAEEEALVRKAFAKKEQVKQPTPEQKKEEKTVKPQTTEKPQASEKPKTAEKQPKKQ